MKLIILLATSIILGSLTGCTIFTYSGSSGYGYRSAYYTYPVIYYPYAYYPYYGYYHNGPYYYHNKHH